MRLGFEGKLYGNTGTAAAPVWTEIDVAGDFSNDEASDEIDDTVRSTEGTKTTSRGLMARGFSFEVESDAPEDLPPVIAALVAASKLRRGFVDLFASDTDASAGATGTRMLSKIDLNDKQPMGDRWLYEFSAKPARATGAWKTAGVKSLDQNYEVPA